MIRKTAVKAILIIAGILFLAHAVVPHHHHGNLICFVQSHCSNDGHEGDHGTSPENHHHDGDDGSGHCMLKDPVVVSSYQDDTGLKFAEKKNTQTVDDNLRNSLAVNTSDKPLPDLRYSLSSPPANIIYYSLSSASLGLRAPPAV